MTLQDDISVSMCGGYMTISTKQSDTRESRKSESEMDIVEQAHYHLRSMILLGEI